MAFSTDGPDWYLADLASLWSKPLFYALKSFFAIFRASCGGVAQLGERRVRNAYLPPSYVFDIKGFS